MGEKSQKAYGENENQQMGSKSASRFGQALPVGVNPKKSRLDRLGALLDFSTNSKPKNFVKISTGRILLSTVMVLQLFGLSEACGDSSIPERVGMKSATLP